MLLRCSGLQVCSPLKITTITYALIMAAIIMALKDTKRALHFLKVVKCHFNFPFALCRPETLKWVLLQTVMVQIKCNINLISLLSGLIDRFSALCFMFGKNIYDQYRYPIGLIESNWGGTKIEVWSSPEATAACSSRQGHKR